eukprot:g40560.t1
MVLRLALSLVFFFFADSSAVHDKLDSWDKPKDVEIDKAKKLVEEAIATLEIKDDKIPLFSGALIHPLLRFRPLGIWRKQICWLTGRYHACKGSSQRSYFHKLRLFGTHSWIEKSRL